MTGGQWMAVLIVAIVMIASIVKSRHHSGRRGRGENGTDGIPDAENARLRQEVAELKERLKVLERITVDKENSLSRQIEELRDR